MKPLHKPSRDSTFMEVASTFAKRSTCPRGQVGAVVVLDNRIVATGYNGAPPGQPECLSGGCLIHELYEWDESRDQYVFVPTGCQRAIHAEANALAWAARHGTAVGGATMYSTHGPCLHCAQLMACAGISCVVFGVPYRMANGLDFLKKMGIHFSQHEYA